METELKIPVHDHEPIVERLRTLGAKRTAAPTREHNVLFDFPDGRLAAAGSVLRLRRFGPRWVLTFKGPATYEGAVKRREEWETDVADGDVLATMLDRLGLEPQVRYEKVRETWCLEATEVALDRTPMGRFVELEGPTEQLEALALELGLDPSRAVRGSYVSLWERHRNHYPELDLPRNMVFPG